MGGRVEGGCKVVGGRRLKSGGRRFKSGRGKVG